MKPTDLAVTIAGLPGSYNGRDGWLHADEVRGNLKKLFGVELRTQHVAQILGRLSKEDSPRFEVRTSPWGKVWEYRVTRFGFNDIENNIPKVKVWR